ADDGVLGGLVDAQLRRVVDDFAGERAGGIVVVFFVADHFGAGVFLPAHGPAGESLGGHAERDHAGFRTAHVLEWTDGVALVAGRSGRWIGDEIGPRRAGREREPTIVDGRGIRCSAIDRRLGAFARAARRERVRGGAKRARGGAKRARG